MGTRRERCWDPSFRIQYDMLGVGAGPNQGVASTNGHWNACDVWLSADATWFAVASAATLTVFAVQGAARVAVVTSALAFVATSSGQMALVASIRGIPCDGFEVEISTTAALGRATIYLETSGCCDGEVRTWGAPALLDGIATTSGVLAIGQARLLEFVGTTAPADPATFIQFYDAAAVPANGAIPTIVAFPLPGGDTLSWTPNQGDRDNPGRFFRTGIAWTSSTIYRSKAEAGATLTWVSAIVRLGG